eukprot:225266_1
MTSLKIWLFISIMCFVTHEIHAAGMEISVKKKALSSSSKPANPRDLLVSAFIRQEYQPIYPPIEKMIAEYAAPGFARRLLVCAPKVKSLKKYNNRRMTVRPIGDDWQSNKSGHLFTRILFCNPPSGKIQIYVVVDGEYISGDISIKFDDEVNVTFGQNAETVFSICKRIQTNWVQLEPRSCEYFTITDMSKNPYPKLIVGVKCEEPRQVEKLFWRALKRRKYRDTSKFLAIANDMKSDAFMQVSDKESKEYLLAQQIRMDFLWQSISRRLLVCAPKG